MSGSSNGDQPCQERNPLVRDGTAQSQRWLPMLHRSRARVDDRGLADLLLLTGRLAEELQYWNPENRPDGDFSAFIRSDPSFVIAELIAYDTLERDRGFSALRATARASGSDLARLFDLLFESIEMLERWRHSTRSFPSLSAEIERHIAARLRSPLERALKAHRWLPPEDLAEDPDIMPPPPSWKDMLLPGPLLEPEGAQTLGDLRSTQDTDELGSTTALTPEDRRGKVIRALGIAWTEVARVITRIRSTAPTRLHESLSSTPTHSPHMALWLAFARLFQHAQVQLNRNTQRHLDFYYERVLRLARRSAIGDRVSLVFTLARKAEPQLLPAGTRVRAGKDASGAPLVYQLVADAAINRATVDPATSIRSVYFDETDGNRPTSAMVACSVDGKGGEFPPGKEPKWHPFGKSQRGEENRTMEPADLGFAIASPELLLREGERTVTLNGRVRHSTPNIKIPSSEIELRVRWTAPKDWAETTATLTIGGSSMKVTFAITSAMPPVVPHASKAHGDAYDTPYPVVELRLHNELVDGVDPHAHARLRDLMLETLTLKTTAKKLRDLVVQGDRAVLDPSKPFLPFGSTPATGSRLYIGSDEAFRKRLETLTLHWSWQEEPEAAVLAFYDASNTASLAILDDPWSSKETVDLFPYKKPSKTGGVDLSKQSMAKAQATAELALQDKLDSTKDENVGLVSAAGHQTALADLVWSDGYRQEIKPGKASFDPAARWTEPPLRRLTARSTWGFLSLSLDGHFGHQDYPRLYGEAVLTAAKPPYPDPILPSPPWTPVMASLHLDYTSTASIDLDDPSSPDTLFHIHPFGICRAAHRDEVTPLVPRFIHDETADKGTIHSRGELYLGLKGLEPRQVLSLLVQVADGSADPETPQPTIHWWYWGRDAWVRFDGQQILRDGTNGFVRSGIIELDVPSDATSKPGLLPADHHWLRVTVGGDPRGLCDLLEVRAQAAQAELVDPQEHDAHLGLPLPAGSITGLEKRRAVIKAVEQPFASYGGRPRESDRGFGTRVSERLRHKNRAVTMWDYERLVLEHFPEIYKAKCVNHSAYGYVDEQSDLHVDSELAPGWVSMIVVPDLRNRNAVDPLEPRASLAVRDRIGTFLMQRMSPWVAPHLQVLDPLYERLQVRAGVSFIEGDFKIQSSRLVEDIKGYLSPWAFPAKGGGDLAFGGVVRASSILHFIEKRPYVDFVTDFALHHYGRPGGVGTPVEIAEPTSARSIFVSHASHTINDVDHGG